MTPRDRISAADSFRREERRSRARRVPHRGLSDASERFREHLRAVAAGADVVEIGVPFTDPMADGVTIQRSSQRALEQGVTLRWILDELAADAEARHAAAADELSQSAARVRSRQARGDRGSRRRLRLHRAGPAARGERELRAALDAEGVALVQMVTPVTEPARLKRICDASQGSCTPSR